MNIVNKGSLSLLCDDGWEDTSINLSVVIMKAHLTQKSSEKAEYSTCDRLNFKFSY